MTLIAHRPSLGPDEAAEIAARWFGLSASATPLPSERDQNFRLDTPSGERFVLKIANATEERRVLEAQHAALARLAAHSTVCPRVVAAVDGATIVEVTPRSGRQYFVRLFGYLPGTPLANVRYRSAGLWRDLGRRLAEIDGALAAFDHPAVHREFHWDLAQAARVIALHAPAIGDPGLRALVERAGGGALRVVEPHWPLLRRGVVHNDGNDHNVLVGDHEDPFQRHQRVTGVIDLGDMVHTAIVAEPAVAMAYAMLGADDPLATAAEIVRGYHAVLPLTEVELGLVFELARLRLCMSVCIAADQLRQAPGDPYLAVSQASIAALLPTLARIPARLAAARMRHAAGLPAVPSAIGVARWLAARAADAAPVLGLDLDAAPPTVVDLGVTSPLVAGDAGENAEPRLTARIEAFLAGRGAAVGVGTYAEARSLYTSALFQPEGLNGEPRTVHLGVDLFAPAGTEVRAPLAGTVRLVGNNDAPLDYGGVVVLEHETDEAEACFTLYGHLAPGSLTSLKAGTALPAGQLFARLGEPAENGGWPPHLHLQVIVDDLGLGLDFPGVARASEAAFWRELSPDPTPLAGVPESALPAPRPSRVETLAARRSRLGGSVRLAYREPLKIVRGWKQYLWDDAGRRYVDAYNNVPHVGHCHPRVVEAGHAQMALLNTNTRYLHDLVNAYAERLAATLPPPLRVCFFLNSASEANELALRLARAHTGARDTIVLEGAYHGHTTTLIDVSPYKHAGPGGQGAPPWVHVAPLPDVYRGRHGAGGRDPGAKYAADVHEILDALRAQGIPVSAFLAETCPSVGGQIFLPAGYLGAVYRAVREAGGICIADEVQTGLGRIGTHFWAFEAHGVVPDIVVMGKPLGNGHPLAAVVTTPDIASSFDNGMEFFSTFGGNPVSCAIGLAVLDVVADEGLQDHAAAVGRQLLEGLHDIARRHELLGDVRGSGLFLGAELVRDRETRVPAAGEASFVVNRMRERGVLAGTDGLDHNVIKIRPPMPFDAADAAVLLSAIDEALSEAR
jgi:4-aminobutyrate aminotransferase-like enzyme/Ser/Thr protein kinase RdoA (MazF antagonist)